MSDILEIANRHLESRQRRIRIYKDIYQAYIDPSPHNKLYTILESIVSLIYSPTNVVFDIVPQGEVNEEVFILLEDQIRTLREEIQEDFYSLGLDVFFYDLLIYGELFGTVMDYVSFRNGEVSHELLFPWEFSFLYEDGLPLNHPSQSICRFYYFPKEYMKEIYDKELSTQTKESFIEPFVKLVKERYVTEKFDYLEDKLWERGLLPFVRPEEYVLAQEIWKRENNAWKVYVVANQQVLYEAQNPVFPEEDLLPFVQYVSNPIINSNYGRSTVHYLLGMQEEVNKLSQELEKAINVYLYPPVLLRGPLADEVAEEISEKLKQPATVIPMQSLQAEFQFYQPQISPADIFQLIEAYKTTMREQLSFTDITTGRPARNVRSASYAQILASFASAPLKKKALVFESFIESCMTLHAILLTQVRKKYLGLREAMLKNNLQFRCDVWAHSTSPMAIEEYLRAVELLINLGVLAPDVILDILPVPLKNTIKRRLVERTIEEKSKESKKET
ncbi:MAG: hypothetical protein QXD29_01840 [Thermoplasmata archaeon]